MFLTLLPLVGSAFTMVVKHAGRLVRASAFALLPLGACATETQGLQEDLSQLEPMGGSSGSGGSGDVPGAGATAGGTPGASGTFSPIGGDGPLGGMVGSAGASAGSGGVAGMGGAGGMGGATGGGGSGGKAGAGGAGGKGGAGGTGGAPANPCATGQLDIDAATSSADENGTLTPNLAFDGDDMSRWASAQSEPQWIYFDLGEVAHVSRVLINWEAAYATNYRLEIAQNSNGPWTSIFQENAGNGAMDNVTTLTASNGRYVRMHGNTRATMYGFSIWEFEIYGDLDETCQ